LFSFEKKAFVYTKKKAKKNEKHKNYPYVMYLQYTFNIRHKQTKFSHYKHSILYYSLVLLNRNTASHVHHIGHGPHQSVGPGMQEMQPHFHAKFFEAKLIKFGQI